MKKLCLHLWGIALLAMGFLQLGVTLVQGQASSQLSLQSLAVQPGQPTQFTFTDTGTGATNYTVQFREALSAPHQWIDVPQAIITDMGGGLFEVETPETLTAEGYFRIRAQTPLGETVTASFNSGAFEVTEGGMVSPVIQFSGFYSGVVRYTISGTAESGDYLTLSGEVEVNGNSAVLPVTFTDNDMIGQLKYLTLTLEAGLGLEVNGANTATITLRENDAEWRGGFVADQASVDFILSIQEANGVRSAQLRAGAGGLLTSEEVPVNLVMTDDLFMADVMGIPVGSGATLLSVPMELSLVLRAENGMPDEEVSPTFIQGISSLITVVPSMPHLNSTNIGMFILQKPPVTPSTNQVDLVTIP